MTEGTEQVFYHFLIFTFLRMKNFHFFRNSSENWKKIKVSKKRWKNKTKKFQRKKEKKEAIRKEIEEKQAEIDRAKQAAETMFLGTNTQGDPGEPREATRRRQEIHWDYDKKGLEIFRYKFTQRKNETFLEIIDTLKWKK